MKFFLDSANLDELKKGAAWGIVDGVTTNPSLIAKEGRPIEDQVRMICDIGMPSIHSAINTFGELATMCGTRNFASPS